MWAILLSISLSAQISDRIQEVDPDKIESLNVDSSTKYVLIRQYAYKECVSSNAEKLDDGREPVDVITRIAKSKCQTERNDYLFAWGMFVQVHQKASADQAVQASFRILEKYDAQLGDDVGSALLARRGKK